VGAVPKLAELAGRPATVLFAGITGSRLDHAEVPREDGARRCVNMLRQVIESCGGRVIKTSADGLMALFPNPDTAAAAAMRMHLNMESFPIVDGSKLAVRVGFHSGPVIQRDDDVYGDTVNVAARLAETAVKGQVLTSEDTIAQLSPAQRSQTRQLYPLQMRGKAQPLALCELLWQQSPDVTDFAATMSALRTTKARLRLAYAGRTLLRRRGSDSIVIGRDTGCELMILDAKASREHCTIELDQASFVLRDHSTNGTYVTVAEERETVVHRQAFTLSQHGWLAFGQPRAESTEIVEYFCE
jgi:adenylate cyclase